MTVPVGTDEPSPPAPGVDHAGERADGLPEPRAVGPPPHPSHPSARDAVAGVCPYLASAGGSWRSAVPSRDHRCDAVQPPAPQTTDKQRRHCLVPEHVECSIYRAARTARATSLAAGSDPALVDRADRRRRAVARTAPIVLEPPRLVDQAMRLQFDRAPGQVALVGLMLVAFAVVAIARFSSGATVPSGSPQASVVAVASPSPGPTPSPTPTSSSSSEPSASASAGPSFRTTYTVKKGDTLSAIASRFKTTAAKIRALNGLKSNTLKVGQVLKIP